jgi:hypothetical protein
MAWQPRDGKSPYGRPSAAGNWPEILHKMETPCVTCGATEKRLVIVKDRATIFCGKSHPTLIGA